MEPRITYVLDHFRNLYDLPDEVQIIYGDYDGNQWPAVRIRSNAGNFFEHGKKVDPSALVFKSWRQQHIPFLFEKTDQQNIIEQDGNEQIINYDIIASSFYFLSGWQEYVTSAEDYVDSRFPYEQSLQYQLNTADVPWVNYYFDILKSAVEQAYDIDLTPKSGDANFRLAVTHDIDTLFFEWFREGYRALRKGRIAGAFRILLNQLSGNKDPWDNLLWLQEHVQQMEANATFYFLAEQQDIDDKKQADYSLDNPDLQQEIRRLEDNGAEIAIHGSIGSHRNADMLRDEMEKLDAAVTGGRFHYLCYDVKVTPQILQEIGLQHDSTLGFAEEPGFRNAYAHPFYLYDLAGNRQTEVLEVPLIIMDATLHHSQYLNMEPAESFDKIIPILQEIEKFHGASSILWHNSYFSEFKYEGWGAVFDELLNYCSNRKGEAVSISELVSHYRFREPDIDQK